MRILQRKGFTLIELLVVIGIIGVLMGLLLPAVQSARESARRLECTNNLKQISLAVLNHENATKRFPTGGWGWMWVGDPDQGSSQSQPGGWVYNILPYLEQTALHNISYGATGTQKLAAASRMLAFSIPEFICSSRRAAGLYPYHLDNDSQTYNADKTPFAARTDYAVNRGDFYVDPGPGPRSYEDTSYQWPDTSPITGISFVRSMIKIQDVTDGLTNTYLIGEKYLNANDYTTGYDKGDNSSLYQGDDFDVARYAALEYYRGSQLVPELVPPVKDMRIYTDYFCFGSAHPATWQVSFCDGSVHAISFDIDPDLHRRLGNRKDGEVVDKSGL
ncbi:MAG TPA: DUF1559 domain-containing protein [Thermoguttaceae bacterium]